MTATKQQWPFYFVLKLLYCKDKRVSILLMPIRQIYWTLANLRGTTVGHFRLLHCRLLWLPLNVSVSFIHLLRSHAFLSLPNGVRCTKQSCHHSAVLTVSFDHYYFGLRLSPFSLIITNNINNIYLYRANSTIQFSNTKTAKYIIIAY